MKTAISILLVVLFSVFISCKKETFENPTKGLLKRKLTYRFIQDTIPRNISEYQYDLKRRLVKIQDNYSTQLFDYNPYDRLIRKYGYRVDGSGSTLRDTTYYKYQDGNLVYVETIPIKQDNYSYSHQTRYEYENLKLVKKKEYIDHQFSEMTVYEYTNNLCAREIYYNDSIGKGYYTYKNYVYDENNQLALSTIINKDEWLLQSAYYFYDDDGNLIWEYGEQIAEVQASFVFYNRYEYY